MTSISVRRSRWIRLLLVMVGLLAGLGIGGAAAFYWLFLRDLPDPRTVADYRPPLASTVVDRNGHPIAEFFNERRRLVAFSDVPKHVIDAFVSAEDASFFEHEGIDFTSIARAAWKNLLAGEKVEGASTITQQMVKGLLLSPERTYTRKIREMILARRIEQRFTKQEILYLYLNQIYFGHGAYGIGEAARSYYAKPVAELTVSEAAQLAGLPKAPSRYSPLVHPDQAERRRRYVLDRMLEDGKIDPSQHARALAVRPTFVDGAVQEDFATAAYFAEEVRRYLFDTIGGQAVLEGGLRIETTLDARLQKSAVAALQDGLEALDHRNGYRGPLRHVERGDLDAEIQRVGQENGLIAAADPATGAPEEEAPAAEPAPPAPQLPLEERKLVGVVTEVDPEAKQARVALGPDLRGEIALADVSWARRSDPKTRSQPESKIERIFAVGDVARFRVAAAKPVEPKPDAEKSDAEGSPSVDAGPPAPLRLALFQEPAVEGALFSLDIASGDIIALVGGYDFARSQFNRATQSRRQPGSAFKPLVYAAALSESDANGRPRYTPASIVHDRPKVYTDHRSGFVWKPKNYEREFYGPITLRRALAKSVNNATLQLCDEIGIGDVIRYARRLGIRSPLEPSLATALGTNGVSLLEITRAYAVFAHGGRRVVPRFVRRVLDRDGNVLLENVALGDPPIENGPQPASGTAVEPPIAETAAAPDAAPQSADGGVSPLIAPTDPDQLLPPEQAYLVTDMLRAVVLEGTGQRARSLGRPVAGKTGTTNDQADAWFVGFSPEIATGVWVGFDEVRFLGAGETGAHAALPVWIDYMRVALDGRPVRDFEVPNNDMIVWARIDRETGLLASHESTATVFQSFISGTEPTETAASAIETNRARQDLREDSFTDDAAAQMPFDEF